MINGAVYRDEAKRKAAELLNARDELKQLRTSKASLTAAHDDTRKKLLETEKKKAELEEGLATMKMKHASLDGNYKALVKKQETLKEAQVQFNLPGVRCMLDILRLSNRNIHM